MNIFEYTKNLQMPLLIPNQSGKEITHNEALIILDNIILNSVISKDLSTPPNNIENGDLYIVGKDSENEWMGKENNLAIYDNGWRFVEPKDGFLFYIKGDSTFYIFQNEEWKKIGSVISLKDLSDINFSNLNNNDIMTYQDGNFINSDELIIKKLSLNGKDMLELDGNNNLILKYFNEIENSWKEIFNIDNQTGIVNFNQRVNFKETYLEDFLSPNIDYVVQRYKSVNNNWCRLWKSGFKEMGFILTGSNTLNAFNFYLPFTDLSSIRIVANVREGSAAGAFTGTCIILAGTTLTTFGISTRDKDGVFVPYSMSVYITGY